MQKKYSVRKLVKWDKRKLLKELKEERKRNRASNFRFVDLYVAWLKRTSNRDWSRQQKEIINSTYKANKKLRLNSVRS
jgi:hypothetical protein